MATAPTARDYSLLGMETKRTEDAGLANADWYACPIARSRLKELMQRRDGPAHTQKESERYAISTNGISVY